MYVGFDNIPQAAEEFVPGRKDVQTDRLRYHRIDFDVCCNDFDHIMDLR